MTAEFEQFVLETASVEETRHFAAVLGRLLAGDAIITLTGDLGAGKTAFVQGLGKGLGVAATITSPTFVLINRYRTADGRLLQHADCYRLANAPLEMWDAGLTDLFLSDDVVVVEWADKIPGLLPPEYLDIAIDPVRGLEPGPPASERRRFTLIAHGRRYEELLHQLARMLAEQG